MQFRVAKSAHAGDGLWGMAALQDNVSQNRLVFGGHGFPVSPETKQHLVPISANIPDRTNLEQKYPLA